MKRIVGIVLAVLSIVLIITACGENNDVTEYIPEETSGELRFYGVVKSDGAYYARVLTELVDSPSEEDFKYVPLAKEIYAEFQPEGWVGAWSPSQYFTAKELSAAYSGGKITEGVRFSYNMTDNRIDRLEEYNYYADNDVTGDGAVNVADVTLLLKYIAKWNVELK